MRKRISRNLAGKHPRELQMLTGYSQGHSFCDRDFAFGALAVLALPPLAIYLYLYHSVPLLWAVLASSAPLALLRILYGTYASARDATIKEEAKRLLAQHATEQQILEDKQPDPE